MTELRAALERHRPCEEDHGDSECGLCEYCEDDWPCLPARALAEIERLEAARALADAQAEDEGLWFIARTAPEAYLQQELRKLHAALEETKP